MICGFLWCYAYHDRSQTRPPTDGKTLKEHSVTNFFQEMRHVDLNGAAKVALESVLPSVQLVLEFIMVINYSISRVPIFVRKQFKQVHLHALFSPSFPPFCLSSSTRASLRSDPMEKLSLSKQSRWCFLLQPPSIVFFSLNASGGVCAVVTP